MTLDDLKITVKDSTIGGKCSNCGECCTEFVPITKNEYKKVKDYLKKHPEITNQRHYDSGSIHVICPFRDREKKRCNIYEVRPLVCQKFICNLNEEQLKSNKMFGLKRAAYNNFDPTTMISFHVLFFNDIQWELEVLYNYLEATTAEDFKQKLKKLNPMIVQLGLVNVD